MAKHLAKTKNTYTDTDSRITQNLKLEFEAQGLQLSTR
jgi:hypothetical protein